jgi:hypothetical protein
MIPNLQNKPDCEDAHKKPVPWHSFLSPLIIIGFVMTFLGFVFPGWLWLLNTPGDTEMITLGAATACGIIGVILMLIGFAFIGFERAKKNRNT